MMFIYLILAIISSWIWVSYFKMINIFDEKKKIYTYLTFILGAFSYYLFYLTSNFLVNNFHFEFSVNWVNQLFISVVKVGLVGEFIKLIPIFIVYFLFKNQFTNPKNIFIYFVIESLLNFWKYKNLDKIKENIITSLIIIITFVLISFSLKENTQLSLH